MSEQGFNQLDYNQELGTGIGATIHDEGCAECSVASECVNAGHATDPVQLNNDLISIGGYAPNGAGANDEIIWGALARLYPNMQLAFVNRYPSNPADMSLIDTQLKKGVGVIVGVSFHHNPNQTDPDHFVRIYKKNDDGSYQCFDSWDANKTGVDTNFNSRYAVNGMSIANAILEAISYNYSPTEPGTNVDAATFVKLVHNSNVSDSLNKYAGTPANSDWSVISTKLALAEDYQNLKTDRDKQASLADKWNKTLLQFGLNGDSTQLTLQDLLTAIANKYQTQTAPANTTVSTEESQQISVEPQQVQTPALQPAVVAPSDQPGSALPFSEQSVPPPANLTSPSFWKQVKEAFLWFFK